MEEKTSKITSFQLPPGFRFHPTDEELIMHYLINKASSRPLPAHVIAEVELYKLNPWDLPKRAVFGEEEWYFFTPRERKYPNGERPNRTAASGYWKATGTDKPIMAACGGKVVGLKKALVFYKGKPPKGLKTDWIMHEYRLPLPLNPWTDTSKKVKGSMRLDDWVLCRVWHKSSIARSYGEAGYGVGKTNLNITTETTAENSQLESCPNNLPFLFGFQQHYHYSNCMDNAVSSLSTASLISGDNSHEAENANDSLSNWRKRKLSNEGQNQEDFIQSDYNKKVNFNGDEPKAEGQGSIHAGAEAAVAFACGDTTTDQLWDIVLQY